MKSKEALKLLDNELIYWSRLGWAADPHVVDDKGEVLLYEDMEVNMKYCRQMIGECGIGVLCSRLPVGWTDVDTYNFNTADKVLDALFAEFPDLHYIPRLTLNAPWGWQKANPDELCLYETADFKNSDEIAAAVQTPMQDGRGAHIKDSVFAFQSFASKKWLHDAKVALGLMIEHLEERYGDRMIGYHVEYGKCGETHFWGSSADHSKVNKKAFYDFCIKKYGSAGKLSAAWGTENITPENIKIPENAERYKKGPELDSFFHMGEENIIYRDYNEYRKALSLEIVNTLCKEAKEKSGGKLVGLFHGYIVHDGADYHGHTDIEELLNGEYVDYMTAPKFYYRCEYGEPCGSHCPPMSLKRKNKVWIEEIDTRTHMPAMGKFTTGPVIPPIGHANNMDETRWVLWREFARCEMSGAVCWYMDLGGGWFDDEDILKEMTKINDMRHTLSKMKRESVSEILVVVDEENQIMTTQDHGFHVRALQDTICETAMTGAPYDMCRQKELAEMDLAKYKLVIFLNAFLMSYEDFSKLKFSENTHFIWNYAPGHIKGDTTKLTGMKVKETGLFDNFPYLEIMPEDGVEVLERYGESALEYKKIPKLEGLPLSGIKTAVKGNSLLAVLPSVNRQIIREFAEKAGCRMYAPAGSIVYADNRFTAIFNDNRFEFKLNK